MALLGFGSRCALLVLGFTMVLAPASAALELRWPTPSTAFADGRPVTSWVMPSSSGLPESGLYGCTRNGGYRFHEGLDIGPVERDASGEAEDVVVAAMPGVIVHVNEVAGKSSYGRYVVIRHDDASPAVVTLYAHLARIGSRIEPGRNVGAGQPIGKMGRSAGGYSIPKSRAHLHFEIGFVLTDQFDSWYDWKRFGNDNAHGLYNGMNIAGLDPLDVFREHRRKPLESMRDYLDRQRPAATFRVTTRHVPDFVRRYPELLEIAGPVRVADIRGWEVDILGMGIPYRWRPILDPPPQSLRAEGSIALIAFDPHEIKRYACRDILETRRDGSVVIDSVMRQYMQLLFGFR